MCLGEYAVEVPATLSDRDLLFFGAGAAVFMLESTAHICRGSMEAISS